MSSTANPSKKSLGGLFSIFKPKEDKPSKDKHHEPLWQYADWADWKEEEIRCR